MNMKVFDKLKWIVLGLLLTVLFVTFLYDDLVITYNHSLNFLDCLFSGNFFGFYDYTMEHFCLGYPADYYVLIYIIFAVWNLPTWLLTKLFGIDPNCILALLWAKAILLPFIMGCFYIIHKMFEVIEEKDTEHLYFMISSSLLFVLPIFAMSQYDIISLFFLLWGLYYCMKDNEVPWKAIVLFAAAIPIKILAVFPVLLMIVLKEKRIVEIVKKMVCSMLGLFICVLPYIDNEGFQKAITYNGGWFGKLSEQVLPSGWSGISIFWLCFFALCIIAYMAKQNTIKEYFEQVVWLLAALYFVFFIFVAAHPQWTVLLVPFMVLMTKNRNQYYKLNMLLEIIASVCLVISQAYNFHWVYFTDITSWLLLKNVAEKSNLLWITSLRDIGFVESLIPMLNAGYLAAVIGLLVINNPWKRLRTANISDQEHDSIKRGIDVTRILAILGYLLVTFLIVYVV